MLRYSGADATNPINVSGNDEGDDNSPTSPSVTTTVDDTRVIRVYGAYDNELDGTPYPGGTTGRLNITSSNNGASLGVADSVQASAGTTGTAAFDLSNGETWIAMTIALAPPQGEMTLAKTADVSTFDTLNELISYSFVVTNTGSLTLNNVTVVDPLPGLSGMSCSPTQPATLNAAEDMTCTATYNITPTDMAIGTVTNTATANSSNSASVDDSVTISRPFEIDFVACLDASGSMSADDWTVEKTGTTAGLNSALAGKLDGRARVTVVQFPLASGTPGTSGVVAGPTIMDSQAVLDAFNTTVNGLPKPGDTAWTNTASCIDVAREVMGCGTVESPATCPDDGVRRIIDISTDGDPTQPNAECGDIPGNPYPGNDTPAECAIIAAYDAEQSGIDVLNVIAVGNINLSNPVAWVFDINGDPPTIFDTRVPPCNRWYSKRRGLRGRTARNGR